jgi:hypothetical protein
MTPHQLFFVLTRLTHNARALADLAGDGTKARGPDDKIAKLWGQLKADFQEIDQSCALDPAPEAA